LYEIITTLQTFFAY